MRAVKKSDITYGQLEAALRSLGFGVSQGKNTFGFPYLRFEKAQEDAVILVRGGTAEELLDAMDFRSTERTLENRGIADSETFHRLLRETARKKPQAA